MLRREQFVMASYQASVFVAGSDFSTSRVLRSILGGFGEVLDGEPLTLPVPEGLSEVPKLILKSRSGFLTLQASPTRLDLVQESVELCANTPLQEFLRWSNRVFDTFLETVGGRTCRLACVVRREAEEIENPARSIAEHFCQEVFLEARGALNRPSDFELHAAKQFDFYEHLRINSWFRCKTVVRQRAERRAVVVIEQDFNTALEDMDARNFSQDDRVTYYERVPSGLEEVMNVYFPMRA